MREHTFGRKKANSSDVSHPSLVSPSTPTLANPVRGFGLPTNNQLSSQQQQLQSADELSLKQQLIQEKPRGQDISRISFVRPQAKLTVGEPGDKYEQEADIMARRVMAMSAHTLQRQIAPGELQTKPTVAAITPIVQQTGNIQRQQIPLQPGPWNPPKNQPIPFYIGNEAHSGIAAQYLANHSGDVVFTNFITISTILNTFRRMGFNPQISALAQSDLNLKPDILNASRRHLYEIKPESSQNLALSEAQIYARIFASAGITITLGPINEPGTRGLIPAPGGFYVFWCPIPGVIVYKYGRQPQPVPQPQPQTEQQTDFRERISKITGLTGTALIIYLILSEGSRLFPPRNLVPVP